MDFVNVQPEKQSQYNKIPICVVEPPQPNSTRFTIDSKWIIYLSRKIKLPRLCTATCQECPMHPAAKHVLVALFLHMVVFT